MIIGLGQLRFWLKWVCLCEELFELVLSELFARVERGAVEQALKVDGHLMADPRLFHFYLEPASWSWFLETLILLQKA